MLRTGFHEHALNGHALGAVPGDGVRQVPVLVAALIRVHRQDRPRWL